MNKGNRISQGFGRQKLPPLSPDGRDSGIWIQDFGFLITEATSLNSKQLMSG
jgi:hypothetical protein